MNNPLIEQALYQARMQELAKQQQKENKFSDRPAHTPDNLSELKPDEVFVFGSNWKGHHNGGASKIAFEKFGAQWGEAKGMHGQTYAIPTYNVELHDLSRYIEEFINYAETQPSIYFYVTKIGCSSAGHTINEIAPLFVQALGKDNICLPAEFAAYLTLNYDPQKWAKAPKSAKVQCYGQVRTLADFAKLLNEQNHYANPHALLNDLDRMIFLYRKRGTVTGEAIFSFKSMVKNNASNWFVNGIFDIEKMYSHLQNQMDNDAMRALDLIYDRREKGKICRVVTLMNEIARYQDVNVLVKELENCLVEEGEMTQEGHPAYWSDSFHYPLSFFRGGIVHQWDKMVNEENTLDNEKLEQVIFGNFEQRVDELGLEEVLKEDYEQDGPCHPEVYWPKEVGTGPVFVEHGEGVFVKSCGEGKGPRRWSENFEMQFLTPVLVRMVAEGEYFYHNNTYIPIKDYDRPIYSRYGKVYFKDDAAKKLYIIRMVKDQKNSRKQY